MNRRTFLGIAITLPLVKGEEIDLQVCKNKPTCRYLGRSDNTNEHICFKLSPKHRQIIDEEVMEYLSLDNKNSLDLPVGDNCSGKLMFWELF